MSADNILWVPSEILMSLQAVDKFPNSLGSTASKRRSRQDKLPLDSPMKQIMNWHEMNRILEEIGHASSIVFQKEKMENEAASNFPYSSF